MKKLLVSIVLFMGMATSVAAFPITGYVQVDPPNAPQPGGLNISSGIFHQLTDTGLTANQCVQTGAGGLLTVTGSNCGTNGGGTFSTLQITQSGVQVTSPTASINFAGPPFTLTAIGSTTTIKLDASSVTLQGKNFYVANQSVWAGQSAGSSACQTENIGIGNNVLATCTTPVVGLDTCIGYNSCASVTSGYELTALGEGTLASNTSGTENTALGIESLGANTFGGHNTGVGAFAMWKSSQSSANTAIGEEAGSGSDGTNIGDGRFIGDASYWSKSTWLGGQTGVEPGLEGFGSGGNNGIAIGYASRVACSNCGVLGKALVGVNSSEMHWGVNIDTPTYNFDVRGSSGLFVSSLTIGNIASGTQCLHANSSGRITGTGSDCGSGGGGSGGLVSLSTGIITPAIFTSSVSFSSYTVITATGPGVALTIIPQGFVSSGYQNRQGALTIGDANPLRPYSTLLVLVDSSPATQPGGALAEIWSSNPNHNDPKFWFHVAGHDSSPEIRDDAGAPNWEMINTSTDNAHGYGKWEPAAVAYQAVDLQVNSRSYDNTTFENLAKWHALSGNGDGRPSGLYLAAQDLTNDSGVLASSNTSTVRFGTRNGHEIGITGPLDVVSGSWDFRLPATSSDQGQLMYESVAGDSFGARVLAFTSGGSAGNILQMNGTSAPTWTASPTLTGVTASSFTANGTGNGNIQLTISGSTYSVTSASTPATNVAGHMAVWSSTNNTLTDGGLPGSGGAGTPGGSQGQLQWNNGSAFAGSTNTYVTVSSITVLSSMTVTTGGALIPSANVNVGVFDIFDNKTPYNGKRLFTVGSSNLQNQVEIPDHAAINATNYGIDAGALQVGDITFGTSKILSNQSSNSFIDYFDATTSGLTFQTGAALGRDMIFNPETVATVQMSSSAVTVFSSMTVKGTLSDLNTSASSAYVFLGGTTTTSGLYSFSVSTTSHVSSGGISPSTSTCGTGAGFTGTDFNGFITPGATAGGCTVTFARPFKNLPVCTVSERTMSLVNALSYTVTRTALTITQTSLSSILDYICTGLQE